MSRDDIVSMAVAAGIWIPIGAEKRAVEDSLIRFAALAATAEREACASACDAMPAPASCTGIEQSLWDVATMACAQVVCARGGNV